MAGAGTMTFQGAPCHRELDQGRMSKDDLRVPGVTRLNGDGTERRDRASICMKRLITKPWTREADTQLRECASRGWNALKISLRLGRSPGSVSRRARQLKVDLRRPNRLPRAERLFPGREA